MKTAMVLDDSPARRRLFRRELAGIAVVRVFDRAGDALDWLGDATPDLVFLDHDLHEYGTDIAESGTGMQVAAYLRQHANRFAAVTAVVVHSLNPTHAPAMATLLRDIGFRVATAPFCWDQPGTLEAAVNGRLFPTPKNPVS